MKNVALRVQQSLAAGVTAVVLAALALSAPAQETALLPVEPGEPERLEIFPAELRLDGPRSEGQLLVTGHYAGGVQQDLTRVATFTPADAAVLKVAGGVARPLQDGTTEIVVSAGGKEARIKATVSGQASVKPRSFEFDALVALSKNGCNSGACHGSPSGKGGFRLSLRAFDPVLDQLTLIREDLGRRANVIAPEQSLLLAKPLMQVPHGGGQKMKKSDPAYAVLKEWIAEGCRPDPAGTPRLVKLAVYPPSGRVYHRPAHTQQLSVWAHFADGSVRDVTPLAVYSSSDLEVAEVSESGLIVGKRRGESAIIVRYLEQIESVFTTFIEDIPGYAWPNPPTFNYIDQHIDAKLQQLKFVPAGVCNDEEFVRRVYLDVLGQLPSLEETQQFLGDNSPNKRSQLIDQLLARPEFAHFWALKWADLLRVTNQQIGNAGVFKYHRWIQRAFETNLPYDQFARELVAASGSTLQNPPANFYRTAADVNDAVESIAQVFLGARMQCAKCHNHPFERWTQDNYYGLAAFFTRVQRKKSPRAEETFVYAAGGGEITQPRTGKQMQPWLPQQGEISPPEGSDRRQAFVSWLTTKENPYFARIEANRIWSHLFGRGIVEPNDDFRDSNPPANAALLDALAKDFAESGFDRKKLIRTILNSRTYQADFRPSDLNKDDMKYFSHYQPRLLGAEQLLDSICTVTGLPEAFAGLPAGTKAAQIPAPDLAKHDFLKIFGQPERQTVCACERTSDSNLGMAIQFFNGPLIYNKIRDGNNRFRKAVAAGKSNEEVVTELYLAAVCRKPSTKEMEASLAHIASKTDRVVALEDVCWALLNTNEFLFQH